MRERYEKCASNSYIYWVLELKQSFRLIFRAHFKSVLLTICVTISFGIFQISGDVISKYSIIQVPLSSCTAKSLKNLWVSFQRKKRLRNTFLKIKVCSTPKAYKLFDYDSFELLFSKKFQVIHLQSFQVTSFVNLNRAIWRLFHSRMNGLIPVQKSEIAGIFIRACSF